MQSEPHHPIISFLRWGSKNSSQSQIVWQISSPASILSTSFFYFLLLVSKCKTHLGSTFISGGTFCCFPPPNSHKLIRLMRDQSDFVCISPLWLQWITGRLVLLACASYTMVAPTTHFKMKACPNTLGASSPHTRKQSPCSLHPP